MTRGRWEEKGDKRKAKEIGTCNTCGRIIYSNQSYNKNPLAHAVCGELAEKMGGQKTTPSYDGIFFRMFK